MVWGCMQAWVQVKGEEQGRGLGRVWRALGWKKGRSRQTIYEGPSCWPSHWIRRVQAEGFNGRGQPEKQKGKTNRSVHRPPFCLGGLEVAFEEGGAMLSTKSSMGGCKETQNLEFALRNVHQTQDPPDLHPRFPPARPSVLYPGHRARRACASTHPLNHPPSSLAQLSLCLGLSPSPNPSSTVRH